MDQANGKCKILAKADHFFLQKVFCQESKLHASRFGKSHKHLSSGVAWQTAQNLREFAILNFSNPCLDISDYKQLGKKNGTTKK